MITVFINRARIELRILMSGFSRELGGWLGLIIKVLGLFSITILIRVFVLNLRHVCINVII
jgi:hypothetical protein